ncbi:MAG TPA: HD-GYP domain-containing protein [Gammaproteobacteria bacterium]|nr:HD-GYP domain-containing protein [Gammaproteobacteria bacterium]
MSSNLDKIPADDLEIGMFVAQLDRPWTDTPFLFQGFYIHHADEIAELQRYCKYVFIDSQRGEGGNHDTESRTITRVTNLRPPAADEPKPVAHKRISYEPELPVEKEMPAAKPIYQETVKTAKAIISQLQKGGELNMGLAEQAVTRMMESVLRNPDAMTWLTRMKQHDSYIYQHSVNSSVWGLSFARHLGLDKQSIYEIGIGCMLFDVGKTNLSALLLAKTGQLSETETQVLHSHVEHSVAILRNTPRITPRVLNLVQSHHERFDGSGYPQGLKGNEIPTFAKIAGMVDCYDALISPRSYAVQRTPYQAVREIYAWRGNLFQPEVVEQFMQVVGVFPTGTLVELNTGAVGVVISQNEARRLRPRLMLILDEKKRQLPRFEIIDLLYDNVWNDKDKFWIDKHVEAAAYGIDPQALYL